MNRSLPALAVFAALAAIGLHDQQADQPRPVFRSRVDLVVLDVSVLDQDRRPVSGLEANDFTVLEDGKPQKITLFSAVDLPDVEEPVAAPWTRNIAADVRRNEDDVDSLVVVLLLDDAAMSLDVAPHVRQYAKQVIESLGPRDLAAVVFPIYQRAGQEFTHDKGRLLAAIDRFATSPATGAIAMLSARMLIDTLKAQADALAALPASRKMLFFLSERGFALPELLTAGGDNVVGLDVAGMTAESLGKEGEIVRALQRANVTVYCLDPAGLRTTGPVSPGADTMRPLSAATGGYAVIDTNDPAPGVVQAYRENRSYYLLGYAASNTRTEGRYRRVQIKVNRPDVAVRTRTGYFEPEPPKKKPSAPRPAVLEDALAGATPITDLPMQVMAAPFAGTSRSAATAAVVFGVQPNVPEAAAGFIDIDAAVNAYDYLAKLRASDRFTVRVALPHGGNDAAFEVMARLALPPGRYHLRVAARQSASGLPPEAPRRSGSVYCDLDVPDFAGAPLSLSGLVLSVTPPIPFARRERLAALLPFLPTTLRQFGADDTVRAFLAVYQGGTGTLAPVAVDARIVDRANQVVFERNEQVEAKQFSSRRAADYMLALPTGDLAAGEYLLTVEAKVGRHTARRDVRFSMR